MCFIVFVHKRRERRSERTVIVRPSSSLLQIAGSERGSVRCHDSRLVGRLVHSSYRKYNSVPVRHLRAEAPTQREGNAYFAGQHSQGTALAPAEVDVAYEFNSEWIGLVPNMFLLGGLSLLLL